MVHSLSAGVRFPFIFLTFKNHKMNIYKIKTSSWDEENFILITDLDADQIGSVFQPLRDRENMYGVMFDNETYFSALVGEFPNVMIEMHYDIETLTF